MAETRNYLIQYQKLLGVKPDGDLGPKTARAMMADLKVTDKLLFAHVIAQGMHESEGWTHFRENLNYGAPGLLNIFRKYYIDKPGLAEIHAHNPKAIANYVYANRNGNGDEKSGDGWFYRGAFGLQTTGKANFLPLFEYLGLPPGTDPDSLKNDPRAYFKSMFFWFKKNDAEKYCTSTSLTCVDTVGKKVNRGNAGLLTPLAHGNDERRRYAKQMFRVVAAL